MGTDKKAGKTGKTMTQESNQKHTKSSRREQILQALVQMLENNPGARITTSNLAKEVGLSEAALYRHFASKAKMFEGLIEFIEDAVFSRVNRILHDEPQAIYRCEHLLTLVLAFADRNPGLCRILTGEALVGENERLRSRVSQFYERLETQLKQILREAEIRDQMKTRMPVPVTSQLLLSIVEGRIQQYARSGRSPVENWPEQWAFLAGDLMTPVAVGV